MIVRVVPNVTGLDKRFDYRVPAPLQQRVHPGSIVRIDLNGRRVGGWITEIDPDDGFTAGGLAEVARLSGLGPDAALIDLAEWAAVRWAGRTRQFLAAASPVRTVSALPAARNGRPTVEPVSPATSALLAAGGGLLELPPTDDPVPSILSAVALGPTIVITPSVAGAALLAARLRRTGVSVALMPDDWAAARAGVDVVVGTRTAAWAPCDELTAIVVLDEHDESLQQESSPTWHARDVALERGRRANVPVVLVSPCPSMTALEWSRVKATSRRPSHERIRRGWPSIEVVDRSDVEPWKRSLLTSELIQELRDPDRTVVCVSNTKGRARLLACRHCRALAQCERCEAAVELGESGQLHCRRCGTDRPQVCQACGRTAFANIRPGVARLVEELGAAAGRAAVLVEGDQNEPPASASVYVGTEAVLHRLERADTVAFLEFDRELLAPRYRAGEQAMALLVRAARLTGPARLGGKLLIQTFLPDHPVVAAAVSANYSTFSEPELARRSMLDLPPFAGYAEISGPGADAFVASLPSDVEVAVVATDVGYVVRAPGWERLGTFLRTGVRQPHARLRIAVDPPR